MKLKRRVWPSGEVTWLARFVDPDTGKERDENLTKLELHDERSRAEWARTKSGALARRRAEIASGGVRKTGATLGATLDALVAQVAATKRERTADGYRLALALFKGWAEGRGIKLADDLTPQALAAFRGHVEALKRVEPGKTKRAERAASSEPLAAASRNGYLKTLKAALNELRRLGQLPGLRTESEIMEALRPFPEPKRRKPILKPAAVRALVTACMAHDAERWDLTRDEQAGEAAPGSTAKYVAITPLVVTLLLTGLRLSEALGLTWAMVDLEALDDAGEPVGAITVTAELSKTREERVVDFGPSPCLRAVLGALRLKAGSGSRVFHAITEGVLRKAEERLKAPSRACPKWTPQALRRTCGSFLVCSPSIYGAAAPFLAAKRLGHSIAVAERHYLNAIRGLGPSSTTLEQAMGISDLVTQGRKRASASR